VIAHAPGAVGHDMLQESQVVQAAADADYTGKSDAACLQRDESSAPAHNAAVAKVRMHDALAQAEPPLAAALLLCGRYSCCICLLLQLLQLVPECRGICIPA
jgi:hypothetical protein